MTEPHTTTTLTVAIVAAAIGGALSVLLGLYPGALLLVLAAALAVSQRTALARAIRTPGNHRRRNRLVTAGVLAVVSVGSVVSYLHAISDEHVGGTSLVVHNAIGVPAMIGTVIYLIIGLLTPGTARHDELRSTRAA